MTTTFDKLGIGAPIIQALKENGFESPFPIQQAAIPFLLKGVDVVGQAHTGTGKTAAFSLPILTKIKNKGPIQALILVPTRELAMQVTTEINKFAKYTGIRTVSIYGGQSINLQFDHLRRGVQILVATPEILRLDEDYMKDYEEIRLNKEEISLETITQSYLVVKENEKFKHLCNFIEERTSDQQTIIFVSTKQRTQRILNDIKDSGIKAITIHGDLSQRQRDDAIYRFMKGKEDVLVATDIVSRGIDVPAVGHIINYDVPEDPTVYFHRIGRTARAGGTGTAISLVSSDRVDDFGRILRKTELPIRRLNEEMGLEVPVSQQRSFRGYNNSYRSGYGNSRGNRRYESSTRYGYNNSRYNQTEGRYSRHHNFKRYGYNEDHDRSHDKHFIHNDDKQEKHGNGGRRGYYSSR